MEKELDPMARIGELVSSIQDALDEIRSLAPSAPVEEDEVAEGDAEEAVEEEAADEASGADMKRMLLERAMKGVK
jgi:hypothetical protein